MDDLKTIPIQRYSVVRNQNGLGYADGVAADPSGWLVEYSEYSDLAAEVLRLRAEVERLAKELNHALTRMNAAVVEIEHAERIARAALKGNTQ